MAPSRSFILPVIIFMLISDKFYLVDGACVPTDRRVREEICIFAYLQWHSAETAEVC
jgi:hypothetical protein